MADQITSLYRELGAGYSLPDELRDWQVHVLVKIMENKNVFGVFPTRAGKSLVYQTFPLFVDRVSRSEIKKIIYNYQYPSS